MKKTIIIFCTLIILLLISLTTHASKFELYFTEVHLVSRASGWDIIFPMPEPGKNESEVYRIDLKGIGEKKGLHVTFSADDQRIYTLMADHIEVQYCVLAEPGEEEQWSEWIFLNQLPLAFELREHKKSHLLADPLGNDVPAQYVLLLRFRVPEPAHVPAGVYIGRMSLEFIKF